MKRVRKIPMPPESRLAARLAEGSFHDAFEAPLYHPQFTAVRIAEVTLGATPPWVESLIRLRNHLAKPFGIAPVAPLGRLGSPQGAWRPGDRFSMFTIDSVADDELVLTIADAHLDVWISFLRRAGGPEASYVIASLVRTHNRVGAVYMWPVGIVHPLLVIGMMARLPV